MSKTLVLCAVLLSLGMPAHAQSVDTAWVRRYNGPGNNQDQAYAIAVDGSGDVYVTGHSFASGTWESSDYATIKYYPNGDTAWVRRYDGPGNDYDGARAMAVDDSGNVYVTGSSFGNDTFGDFATIKYDSSGNEIWVKRYNGPRSWGDGAKDLAIDNFGGVCVTGWSIGVETGSDYATIKYYTNGDTAWVRRYSGSGEQLDVAYAIAVDNAGNVYATGYSVGSGGYEDYATIKYYPNGDTAWVRRYNGPGNSSDLAFDVVTDGPGNIYVTGYSHGGETYGDYATIKYDSLGNELWVRRYNGSADSSDAARAIAADNSGNVYVTGYSLGEGASYDYATIRYYPNGDTAWMRRYSGAGDSTDDIAVAIAIDSCGNAYVTGYSWSAAMYDYATIKYDSSGNELWAKRYNGSGDSDDMAYDIVVCGCDTVYVTGAENIWTPGGYDFATIKYVQNGNYVKDETGSREKPSEFALSQNYPNSFNQSTKIEFTLAKSGFVSLNIYDILGRKVKTLVSEHLSSGYKSVLWDGKNKEGKEVASGIYFYRISAGGLEDTKRMILMK